MQDGDIVTTQQQCRLPSRVRRDGSLLMVSTAVTAALNLLFWVAAARTYSTKSVGQAAAEIAAITLLAGVAQLNMLSVFLRFLPGSGGRTTRFLACGYAAIGVASVLAGTPFVLFGFGSGFLSTSALERSAFVLAITVFALFIVQDGILTSFRKTQWVTGGKLTVGIAKLVLLVPLLGVRSPSGITSAWSVPPLVAVLIVTAVVFCRLAPDQVRQSAGRSALPPAGQLASFVVAEYLNNLVSNVVTFVPPLLVMHLLGSTTAAYFNVPWLVVITMQTLLWNIVMSFIVESTRQPDQILRHARQTIKLGAIVVPLGMVFVLSTAPLLLGLQGGDFAARGTPLLRLLALSLPFTAVVIFYSSLAILERRMWKLVLVNALAASALLIGTLKALAGSSISGVGLTYVVVQAALAAFLLPAVIIQLRSGQLLLPEAAAYARYSPNVATLDEVGVIT